MLADRRDDVDDHELNASGANPAYHREVAAWCSERYKSYRRADNTYQPYNGARRKYEPPFTASLHNTFTSDLAQHVSNAGNGDGVDDHIQWCFARYRSYNPDDNTYMAYSGEIRDCGSPYI